MSVAFFLFIYLINWVIQYTKEEIPASKWAQPTCWVWEEKSGFRIKMRLWGSKEFACWGWRGFLCTNSRTSNPAIIVSSVNYVTLATSKILLLLPLLYVIRMHVRMYVLSLLLWIILIFSLLSLFCSVTDHFHLIP